MVNPTLLDMASSYNFVALSALVPELLLAASAIIFLMGGVLAKRKSTDRGLLVLGLGVLAAMFVLLIFSSSPFTRQTLFHHLFIADNFSQIIKAILVAATLLILVISDSWLVKDDNQKFEYLVLVLFSLLGMMLMVSANDMLSLYISLELASLPLYVLASFSRDTLKSTESGIKYFVLGSLASCILLFGISLVYGFAGTTGFEALKALLMQPHAISRGVVLGLVLIVTGLSFKVSAAPFHMWTPDVYEGAPTPVTAFFSVVPKMAAVALFARVMMQPFGAMVHDWKQILVFVSLLSMVTGAFGALTQTNIKRLLAYGSIGHAGYGLMGLACGTIDGISGLVLYFILYIPASVGTFAILLMMQKKGHYLENISDFAGLSRIRPRTAFCLAVFMFSMAGIPPLAGFFGKMMVFLAAMHAGLFGLAVTGVLASVVACFYYLKIIKVMYFDEPPAEPADTAISPVLALTACFCAGFIVLFFIVPTPLILVARDAARALFQ